MKIRFSVGDKVMAKWPGSALYFHAAITKVSQEDGTVEVLYEDGTEMEIPANYVSSENVFARKKSPARRRSRSRSPGRSPARQKKLTSLKKEKDEKDEVKKVKVTSEPVTYVTRRIKKFESEQKTNEYGVKQTINKSYKAEVVLERKENLSVQEMDKHMKGKTKQVKQTEKKEFIEFGGPFGVFFMYLTVPIFPLLVITACSAHKCEAEKLTLGNVPQKLKDYFDLESALILLGFMLFHAVIYALPFGYIADGPDTPSGKKIKYRISAFYTLIFTAVAYSALIYYKYPVTMVYDKMLQIATATTVFCYIANILVHFKSYTASQSELNPHANTGCTIYDVFLGRELHPRFGKYFDFKLYLYRPAMTGWILVDLVYVQKELEMTGAVRPLLAVLIASQIFYCIAVFFWDEEQCPYMFDVKNEGAGFLQFFGELVIVPFVYTIQPRYILEHQSTAKPSVVIYALFGIFFFLGLILIIGSEYQKFKFRKNPYDPQLSGYDSLPPSKKGGDRLLVSGFWGTLRHPNYLGEILVGISWGLLCGFSHIIPWTYALFVTGLLFHRSLRDEVRCKERHGYAWNEYCKRVPYRIVPYIY